MIQILLPLESFPKRFEHAGLDAEDRGVVLQLISLPRQRERESIARSAEHHPDHVLSLEAVERFRDLEDVRRVLGLLFDPVGLRELGRILVLLHLPPLEVMLPSPVRVLVDDRVVDTLRGEPPGHRVLTQDPVELVSLGLEFVVTLTLAFDDRHQGRSCFAFRGRLDPVANSNMSCHQTLLGFVLRIGGQ